MTRVNLHNLLVGQFHGHKFGITWPCHLVASSGHILLVEQPRA